ncbi:MAG: glutamyl-tRNA reductase [Legionellaceae bacterium]|nr:glutamyl-tRNA reductase [Legionellaceae bacterium]
MVFVASGLNYKTAPLALREKMAQLSSPDHTSLERLLHLPFVSEAVILSTCNRTELYCKTDKPSLLISWLAEEINLELDSLAPYMYQYQGYEALQHLLRVASGLDSMMLGEPQILGQLKQAFRQADERNGVKSQLHQIFPFVFNASKRIRTKSGIGSNPISIASAAARLIGQLFSHYESLEIFIIGSGETAALVAKYLYQHGARKFTIASRTRENADKLALQWHAESLNITDIPTQLPKADVVISATACPLPFIDKSMVEQAMASASVPEKTMCFLDLAIPRDITPDVAELKNVFLYNIDDLHMTIENGLNERRAAAIRAEALIEPELEHYMRSHRTRRAQHAICDYREKMQQLAEQELQRATQKMTTGQCEHAVLREFSDRLTNKLTHETTVGLRQAAADDHPELLTLTSYLLNTTNSALDHEKVT